MTHAGALDQLRWDVSVALKPCEAAWFALAVA